MAQAGAGGQQLNGGAGVPPVVEALLVPPGGPVQPGGFDIEAVLLLSPLPTKSDISCEIRPWIDDAEP
jgi:hypothetical protein